jgi:DNA gyrase subunit A
VRDHQDLLFISQNGMVQRTNAGGISQMGRATQGVRVMNIKDDDCVSAVALVVESAAGADVAEEAEELAEAAAEGAHPADADGQKAKADGKPTRAKRGGRRPPDSDGTSA